MKDATLSRKEFTNGKTPSTVQLDPLFFESVQKGDHILEFGSAWGRVCFELQEKGYNATGFDTNENEVIGASEYAKKTNNEYSTTVTFDVANALELPYENEYFDACILQAFMVTLVDPTHREKVIHEAKRILKPGGIIYLSVFGQTRDNPKYASRYNAHFPITQEKGTFIVFKGGGTHGEELYRVHHYTNQELTSLLKDNFTIEKSKHTTFTSYHGNKSNGFIFVGRK